MATGQIHHELKAESSEGDMELKEPTMTRSGMEDNFWESEKIDMKARIINEVYMQKENGALLENDDNLLEDHNGTHVVEEDIDNEDEDKMDVDTNDERDVDADEMAMDDTTDGNKRFCDQNASLETSKGQSSEVSSVLEAAPVAKSFDTGLCSYKCSDCESTFTSWLGVKYHMRAKHERVLKLCDHLRFVKRAFVHICKICSEKVLCDSAILSIHMRKHNISVPKYKLQYECVSQTENKQLKLLENGASSRMTIGNLCQFTCPECSITSNSFDIFRRQHAAKHTECFLKICPKQWHKFVTRIVTHNCGVCNKLLLCDMEFIMDHVKQHKINTKYAYAKRTGCVKDAMPRKLEEENIEEGSVSSSNTNRNDLHKSPPNNRDSIEDHLKKEDDSESESKIKQMELLAEGPSSNVEIGNLCQFKCPQCSTVCNSFGNLKRKHNGKNVKCSHKIKAKLWEKYVTSVTTHKCGLCEEPIPCDFHFILVHARSHHIYSIGEFAEKTGKVLPTDQKLNWKVKKGMSNLKDQKNNSTDLIHNGDKSKYKCLQCGHSDENWSTMFNHLEEKDHFSPPGPEWSWLKNAHISETLDAALCGYKCSDCNGNYSRWNDVISHVKIHHKKTLKNSDVKTFLSKAIVHVCKICFEKVLCDSRFLSHHMMSKHKLTVPEYKNQYDCHGQSKIKQTKLLEEGASSDMEIGNFCQFMCPHCRTIFNNFGSLKKHHKRKDVKCSHTTRGMFWEKYATKITTHNCGVCYKPMPCDFHFILTHVRCHNISSISEYIEKTGSVVTADQAKRFKKGNKNQFENNWKSPKDQQAWCRGESSMKQMKLLNEGTSSNIEIGNLCKFMCPQCKTTYNNYASLIRRHTGKEAKCSLKIGKKRWETYVTDVTTHNCGVCDKPLLCDFLYILAHIKCHDIKSLSEYAEKTGCFLSSEQTKFFKNRNKIKLEDQQKSVTKPKRDVSADQNSSYSKGNINTSEDQGKGGKKTETVISADQKSRCNTGNKSTSETQGSSAKILENIGNYCNYKCGKCEHSNNSWQSMCSHLKEENHWLPAGKERYRYMTKIVLHECKICKKLLANDKFVMACHAKKSHSNMSLEEYAAKFELITE